MQKVIGMDINQIIALTGLCSFPVYVAYREVASGANYARVWAAVEISISLLIAIVGFLTNEIVSWPLYVYAALLLLSYWRLFQLRTSGHSEVSLSAIAWVMGIALVFLIVFFFICLNRYAFVREGEYRTEVYDRFTGEHHN
jgi:hypothetical protein